jgi:pSer/pThr/pTyr-binding forkhead associated (FHA) protein
VRDLNSINGTFVNGERLNDTKEYLVPMGSELSLTKELTFQVLDPDKEIQNQEYLSSMIKSTTIFGAENIPFKPLPGIRYAPDDGPPIDDDYSPT